MMESFTSLEAVLVSSLSSIFDLVALVGNLLVCLAVYRNRKLRTTNNLYIAALAILGIVFACFVGPSIVLTFITGAWVFGSVYCGIQVFLLHFVEFAMLHTIALTAFNRYCRIVRPALYSRFFMKKKRSFIILASVLLFQAIFFGVLSLPVLSQYKFSYKRASCSIVYHSNTTEEVYVGLKFSLHFVFTCIVVLFCYFKVFRAIREHELNLSHTVHARADAENTNSALRVNVKEIRITRTLLAVVLVFLMCWIPEYIISILLRIKPDILHPAAKRSLLLVPFVSCAANPMIYAATNRAFLVEFRDILLCRWGTARVGNAETDDNVNLENRRSRRDEGMQPLSV